MSVAQIGREVGAEQMIYIEMDRFDTLVEADRPIAKARLTVRVIDIVNGVQLYPQPRSGLITRNGDRSAA